MAIVASGEIKISDINSEKGLSPTAANSSLASLSTSGINNDSPAKPDAIAPHAMSEFYNYDHTFTATVTPTPTPSITPSVTPTPTVTPSITPTITPTPSVTPSPCYGSTLGPVSTVQASSALACAAPTAITLYLSGGGTETYTQPDCSVMASNGYYGDGSGNYYQVSGGALTGPTTCVSPSPTPTPSTTGSNVARLAYTTGDACADLGDPYYVNASCAASFTVGCKLYTNASLTNSVDSGELTGSGPWYVYTTSTIGQYWNYQNNGGSWEATSGPFTCPSPSPTPTITPSITPSVTESPDVTPTPTKTPTPTVTPSPLGTLAGRFASTIDDACANLGDPYYISQSCNTTFVNPELVYNLHPVTKDAAQELFT